VHHLGSAIVPLVIVIAGVRGALFVTGAIVPVIVALRWRPLQRVDAAAVVPVVTIALLRSLHVFRALPVPALEGVARKTHTFSVAAGASIVRQGEPGDRYYAIADGTVEVVKDGSRVATHGRGEGFGEIALLHGITRTASVFAVTTATLTAIEREPFLVAVTGHGQTHERFEGVASYRLAVDSS